MRIPVPYIDHHPLTVDTLSRAHILYTDLDGTLLGRGGSVLTAADGTPTLEPARAVMSLNAAGLPVVPVSGRNRLQLGEITRLLGWTHGFVAEIGCVIVPERGAEPLYFTGDWPDDALRPGETPYDAIMRVGAYQVLTETFPGRIEHHAPHHLNREATFVLRGGVDVATVADDLAALELPVELVDNGIIHPLHTNLCDVDEVHAYHLAPAGISKTRAVAEDLARRAIDPAGALSIGDSATDVEMADVVALAILVANAFADERVVHEVETRGATLVDDAVLNIAATHGENGHGWAELADAWIELRG